MTTATVGCFAHDVKTLVTPLLLLPLVWSLLGALVLLLLILQWLLCCRLALAFGRTPFQMRWNLFLSSVSCQERAGRKQERAKCKLPMPLPMPMPMPLPLDAIDPGLLHTPGARVQDPDDCVAFSGSLAKL